MHLSRERTQEILGQVNSSLWFANDKFDDGGALFVEGFEELCRKQTGFVFRGISISRNIPFSDECWLKFLAILARYETAAELFIQYTSIDIAGEEACRLIGSCQVKSLKMSNCSMTHPNTFTYAMEQGMGPKELCFVDRRADSNTDVAQQLCFALRSSTGLAKLSLMVHAKADEAQCHKICLQLAQSLRKNSRATQSIILWFGPNLCEDDADLVFDAISEHPSIVSFQFCSSNPSLDRGHRLSRLLSHNSHLEQLIAEPGIMKSDIWKSKIAPRLEANTWNKRIATIRCQNHDLGFQAKLMGVILGRRTFHGMDAIYQALVRNIDLILASQSDQQHTSVLCS
ncbi:hypothetical protein FisN_9Lh159 [Fistulifera solaris]|uniref:Uncharacterized protein n=1 Tax=Fistulifera solaris TaxID=1519565 RepID=A0A1Z5KKM3_FISSO|nr:hypothetical protein FisN_9Lh159 [Fistulifera solaris]|eukprot:GAX26870.1 hypothetical protein FisN_9Lh159 [Fistulifera solaris]